MPRWALLFGLVQIAGLSGVAAAQTVDQQRCFGQDIDLSIAGCTAVIQSGQQMQQDLARAFARRGWAYANKGQHDNAIEDEDQAIRLSPDDAFAFHTRGAAYFEKGQYDSAIEDFDQAIKLKPDDAAAFADRGAAYFEKGQYDRAIEDYKRALALDPRNEAARWGVPLAYRSQAIERAPNPAPAFAFRGELYAQSGQTDRAFADYNQAIKLDPHHARGFVDRGTLYTKTGQYERAIQDYDEAVRLSPNNASAFSARSEAFRALGQQAQADEDFAKAKQLSQERADDISRRTSLLDKLFPFLMILGFISPVISIAAALIFYAVHCHRIEPERRVRAVTYILWLIAGGGIAGFFGWIFGLSAACSSPQSSNLCGFWGFFVTGPLSFSLAIFFVGLALFLVRPSQSRGRM